MTTKKWYQSKKFWASIIPALVALIDTGVFQATGQHIPTEAIVSVAGTALAYIFMEGANDRKGIALALVKKVNPAQDPALRELILSLIANGYDFKKASEDLGKHSSDVIANVIKTLADAINPELQQDQELKAEVARQVAKMYEQDLKLTEGHALAKAVG